VERLTSTDSFERLQQWLREHLPPQGALRLPVTKKALAAQLGMAPETLSRGLRSLQDMGFIHVQGQHIRRTAPF
jgi:CRP/FNR family transcriptional regulator